MALAGLLVFREFCRFLLCCVHKMFTRQLEASLADPAAFLVADLGRAGLVAAIELGITFHSPGIPLPQNL